MAVRRWLGDTLLNAGLVTRQQLDEALAVQNTTGQKLGQTLVSLGYLTDAALLQTLCADAGIPYLTDDELQPQREAGALLTVELARSHAAVPLKLESRHLVIAMADPFDLLAIRSLTRAAGRPIRVVGAQRDSVLRAIEHAYAAGTGAVLQVLPAAEPAQMRAAAGAATPGVSHAPAPQPPGAGAAASRADSRRRQCPPVQSARLAGDPGECSGGRGQCRVRRGRHHPPRRGHVGDRHPHRAARRRHPRAVPRGRVAHRGTVLPQDRAVRPDQSREDPRHARHRGLPAAPGRTRAPALRVARGGPPCVHLPHAARRGHRAAHPGPRPRGPAAGQARRRARRPDAPPHRPAATARARSRHRPHRLRQDDDAVRRAHGAEHGRPVHHHPRGPDRVRDPLDPAVAGERAGRLTFASGLRSILRHDPNIILVGEIRDQETMQIALSAALTGHLVLTTLHTTTAAGTIPRLLDMGAEPFVIASAVSMFISQRLVRVLCNQCKTRNEMSTAVRKRFGLDDAVLYAPRGCAACRNTGYRGRLGIFELLPMSPDIVAAIDQRTPAEQVHRDSGRPTLLQDGLRKVRAGQTTLDEILRVTT